MLTVNRKDRRHKFMHKLICYAEVANKVAQIKLFYQIIEHWPKISAEVSPDISVLGLKFPDHFGISTGTEMV